MQRLGNAGRLGLWLALAFLAAMLVISIFAPLLAPYDPLKQNLADSFAAPSWTHPFGTDNLGRDVLSRIMWGARPALAGLAIAVACTALVGIPWGLAAGYLGGPADLVLMLLADAVLVFPGIILALVLASVLGPSLASSMVALGLVYSPVLARVMRSGVLNVRNRDFVVLTALYGLPARHRMWRHVLPNALAPAIVQLTLIAGTSLIAQTGLSFLGIGLQPPLPSWGASLAESFRFILVNSAATVAPGLTVVLTVLSLYRVGDALRDVLVAPLR
jgi:peptide/nickel transport system permease protein